MAKVSKGPLAPLSAAQLAQLRADANDLWSAAKRKGTTLDRWEHSDESAAARDYFHLGTWLFYYSTRIGKVDALQDRIDCARRIFESGIQQIGYRFFTIFDFGNRQFDTLFEMGDAQEVLDGLREIVQNGRNANLIAAFSYMGWSLERKQMALF